MLKVTMTAIQAFMTLPFLGKQATLKNHPNIVAGGVPTFKENKSKEVQYTRSTVRPDAKVFVSNTRPVQGDTSSRHNTEKHCQEKMRDREGDAQSSPWDILISVKLFLDDTKTEVCFPRGPQRQQARVVAILNIHQQPLHNAISTSSDEFI